MSLRAMNGWLRLLVLLLVIWVTVVALVCSLGTPAPLHSWLTTSVPTPADPLGLFQKIIWSRLLMLTFFPLLWLWVMGFIAAWVYEGFSRSQSSRLLIPGRLQDVLALIQVLALDKFTDRSSSNLALDLQGLPKSTSSWWGVAADHPEFFRYQPDSEHCVSLIARHVLPKSENGDRVLPVDFTGKLLSLAVELHDRQLRRARAWEVFVPVVIAVVAATASLLGLALKP